LKNLVISSEENSNANFLGDFGYGDLDLKKGVNLGFSHRKRRKPPHQKRNQKNRSQTVNNGTNLEK
jgi:hypothetical protein